MFFMWEYISFFGREVANMRISEKLKDGFKKNVYGSCCKYDGLFAFVMTSICSLVFIVRQLLLNAIRINCRKMKNIPGTDSVEELLNKMKKGGAVKCVGKYM